MRPSLRARTAVAAGMIVATALVPGSSGAQGTDEPFVTGAVQVSNDPNPTRGYSTPQIARNPTNGVLTIADCDARNNKTLSVYRSVNEGRSWDAAGDAMVEPWVDVCGNPDSNVNHTMTYDKDGVLYIAFQANDPRFSNLPKPDRPMHIFLARSTDDGDTFSTVKVWDAPEAADADRGLKRNDRPWVAVDPNEPRYVYVSWMQFHQNNEPPSGNKALIAASSDGGRTFGRPFSLRDGDPQGSYEARPAVDGKGVVHAVFAGRGRVPPGTDPSTPAPIRTVLYRSSSDHGATWTDARQIEEGNAGFAFNRKWALKADPNRDSLYVVWYGHPNPRATRPDADRDIWFRASHDSGRTWSERKVVNTSEPMPNVQHYDPSLSIAPNGRLDIVWYDGRHSPTPEVDLPSGNSGGFQDVYYRYSTDGGRTFSREVKVTDRIIDRSYGVWSNNHHVHGPLGIVSTDDAAFITWQDSRNGTNTASADDTYFASVLFREADRATAGDGDDDDVPAPVLLGAGVAGGMALAMLAAVGANRRSRPDGTA